MPEADTRRQSPRVFVTVRRSHVEVLSRSATQRRTQRSERAERTLSLFAVAACDTRHTANLRAARCTPRARAECSERRAARFAATARGRALTGGAASRA